MTRHLASPAAFSSVKWAPSQTLLQGTVLRKDRDSACKSAHADPVVSVRLSVVWAGGWANLNHSRLFRNSHIWTCRTESSRPWRREQEAGVCVLILTPPPMRAAALALVLSVPESAPQLSAPRAPPRTFCIRICAFKSSSGDSDAH